MKAQLVLCDWAEVVGGKLYLQGGGWATIAAAAATQTAVAVLIDIPYTQTNRQHDGVMALYNQDNQPYPPQQPFRIEFQLEAGRPPGMLVGQNQTACVAFKLNNVPFTRGAYRYELLIDDKVVAEARFVAR